MLPKKPSEDEESGVYGVVKDPEKEKQDAEEEQSELYEEEEEHFDPRGPAQAAIVKPSNWLLITGGVGALAWLILAGMLFIRLVFPPLPNEDESAGPGAATKEKPFQEYRYKLTNKTFSYLNDVKMPFEAQNRIRKELQDKVFATEDELSDALSDATKGVLAPEVMDKYKKRILESAKRPDGFFDYMDLMWILLMHWALVLLFILLFFLCGLYCGMVIVGAVKIQSLESRTFGMMASFMAMFFPLTAGGLSWLCWGLMLFVMSNFYELDKLSAYELGQVVAPGVIVIVLSSSWCIRVGFWNARTLMRPEVVEGFEFVPDSDQ